MRGEGRAAYRRRELARGLRERAPAVTLLESCAGRERRYAAAAKGGQRLVFPASEAGPGSPAVLASALGYDVRRGPLVSGRGRPPG